MRKFIAVLLLLVFMFPVCARADDAIRTLRTADTGVKFEATDELYATLLKLYAYTERGDYTHKTIIVKLRIEN